MVTTLKFQEFYHLIVNTLVWVVRVQINYSSWSVRNELIRAQIKFSKCFRCGLFSVYYCRVFSAQIEHRNFFGAIQLVAVNGAQRGFRPVRVMKLFRRNVKLIGIISFGRRGLVVRLCSASLLHGVQSSRLDNGSKTTERHNGNKKVSQPFCFQWLFVGRKQLSLTLTPPH